MPPAVSLALDKGTVLHNRSFGRHPNCTCTWHDQNSSCTHGTYTGRDMAEVAQWSSMTILDYITANYDRAASSLHTRSSIRNVGQTSRGKFWLFDNEAAFFLSYQLLHQGSPAGKWLERAHSRLLRSTCVFQQNVIQSVLKLQRSSDPADVLEEYVRVHEPLYDHVTVENDASELLREFFPRRLRDVVDWIRHCQVM
ncbi:hypothetical protein BaRGS_00031865 [Batillaria attramentaria]|uniref:Uncharacterized protein n=1 Tax=Batillaria attramentaria TaxID=370345 RepID=A0ABD0JQC2_9CAEN